MKMSSLNNTNKPNRRSFVGPSSLTFALMQFGILGAAHAKTSDVAINRNLRMTQSPPWTS